MKQVGFGTDGWRGIMADGFTMYNLGLVVQAVMAHLKRAGRPNNVMIGYDTRFMSDGYARLAASVAAGNGFRAVLSPVPVTSPMLSHAVSRSECSGGLMVTASHNPFRYNGIKFKAPFGGSAYPGITSEIEKLIGAGPVEMAGYEEAMKRGMAVGSDFFPPYARDLCAMVDMDAVRDAAPEAVFDCMHGASGAHAARLWAEAGLDIRTIRANPDPYFGGCDPEPVDRNLTALKVNVTEAGCGIGFATDGDGDRLGVVDSRGMFVSAHRILSLLAVHLSRNRGMSGALVKTVSTSSLVDRVAADLGLPVVETPVGFKHICEEMLKGGVLIGGEENGGVGVRGFIPERDGFLAALLVLEMLAAEGRGIDEMSEGLDERYGRLYYKRYDFPAGAGFGQPEFEGLCGGVERAFGGFGPVSMRRLDGCKAVFGDGSWILFRLSGTEPLVRVYVESQDEGRAERLIDRAKEVLVG